MIYLAYKWGGYSKSEIDTLLTSKADTSHTHTKSDITDFPTIPSKTSELTNDSGFLTSHQSLSNYVDRSTNQTIGGIKTFTDLVKSNGRYPQGNPGDLNDAIYNLEHYSWDTSSLNAPSSYGTVLVLNTEGNVHTSIAAGWIAQIAIDTSNHLFTRTKTNVSGPWSSWVGYVPNTGGAVMDGWYIARSTNDDGLTLCGGTDNTHGASISIFSTGYPNYGLTGAIRISLQSYAHNMCMYADGSWAWDGTACQVTSDARLKQQISKIDNALLDAWEDVELVQFKYNDAVEQKGDNARLHTGYVVQQIDEACQKHDVDISAYGLYCHEEYPERTEEVTIENEDGTTSKETKVVEPAKEHYSLRYTETLVVECAYLRRENAKLKEQLQKHEDYLKLVEEHLHLKNL